jgi:hypothetical protein
MTQLSKLQIKEMAERIKHGLAEVVNPEEEIRKIEAITRATEKSGTKKIEE